MKGEGGDLGINNVVGCQINPRKGCSRTILCRRKTNIKGEINCDRQVLVEGAGEPVARSSAEEALQAVTKPDWAGVLGNQNKNRS